MTENKPFTYGSVCSGIEAATVAWHSLGWQPSFFSEIDKFPRTLLQHHYPHVPLHGDFTTIGENDYGAIDLLVGGTPCQSFSVAGLRKGFADERGNLTLEFVRLAQRLKPRWILWENVPGVLSIDRGRAFGSFLGGLAECGYGFAYRILDAQYFGVPQRRRRVFVVGYLGDWRPAAAVLFEQESLRGDITPRREAREEVAGTFTSRAKSGGWGTDVDLASSGYMRPVAGALGARTCLSRGAQDADCGHLIARTLMGASAKYDAEPETYLVDKQQWPADVASTLDAHYGDKMGLEDQHVFGQSGSRFVPVLRFDTTQVTSAANRSSPQPGDPCHTLAAGSHAPAITYGIPGNWIGRKPENGGNAVEPMHDVCPNLTSTDRHAVACAVQVRRLTPRECERLQGFPDDYTLLPGRAADGPRYKALGNSMAVPVMRWLGERIKKVERLI